MKNITEKDKKCIRYITNEMSNEDRSVFEIEFSIDDELKHSYEYYKKIWDVYPKRIVDLNSESSLQKIEGNIKKRTVFKKRYAIAAALLLLLLTVTSAILLSDTTGYTNIKFADKGERLHFLLPDGSSVVLNAGSTLKYNNKFSDVRSVLLDGEAFFEVVKDHGNEFIVHTKEIDVKVLGTSFSVFSSIDKQSVSLETGKVNVLLKKTKDKFNLLPKEQLIWNIKSNEISKKNYNPENTLSWKDDILFLDNLPFSKAIHKINKFYGVEFIIEGDAIKKQRITGSFKDQGLDEFISTLEYITNVKVTKYKDKVFTIKASDEN
ncbi:FecR family protein [Formosa sp. L2A11]|uniref:FecR family protein n=1 Tax=Formosa sp. L2A11 TaxID=2686363 RepID=UPI00131B72A1|nr:FecR domain-containing protein [Formosa sp. L2A11]